MARKRSSSSSDKAGMRYQPMQAPLANGQAFGRSKAPRVTATGNGLIVRNQEFWTTFTSGAGTDALSRVGLNPADPNVFNWLAGIADRYTYYRWRKLRICYGSMCPSTQLGDVTLGLFYDREDLDAWFSNTAAALQGLTQTVGSSAGPCWGSTIRRQGDGIVSDICAVADVARAHMRTTWHLIDHATASTALDNQAVAVFLGGYINANGDTSWLPCGRVWFDYEIELAHPTAMSANASAIKRGWDPEKDTVHFPSPSIPQPPAPAPALKEDVDEDNNHDCCY